MMARNNVVLHCPAILGTNSSWEKSVSGSDTKMASDEDCGDLHLETELDCRQRGLSAIGEIGEYRNVERLDLSWNRIRLIEDLEHCVFLRQLDLSHNQISCLTSVENLCDNICLEELRLSGNPCASYEAYREYVIAALPYLKVLDGIAVERGVQISAVANFLKLKAAIIRQQQ